MKKTWSMAWRKSGNGIGRDCKRVADGRGTREKEQEERDELGIRGAWGRRAVGNRRKWKASWWKRIRRKGRIGN